jgi:hypothetical protein
MSVWGPCQPSLACCCLWARCIPEL